MAEFKKNFLKSKMNKDLDERLIPNGQYRDALNIQISSSEDNNTGSAQNLKGNELVGFVDHRNMLLGRVTGDQDNAFCVGSFSDETNKRIYSFIHKASDLVNDGTYNGVIRKTGIISDCIFEFNAYENENGGFTRPVLTDVYEVRSAANVQETQNIVTGLSTVAFDVGVQGGSHVPAGIRVGMRVQKVDLNGVDLWGEDSKVYVKKILPSSEDDGQIEITAQGGFFYNQIDIDNGVVLKFTSTRILNFNDGLEQVEANTTGTPTTPTPKNNIITGINLINDILYFTDNKTEPKKVSLKRFRHKLNAIYTHSIHRWNDSAGNLISTPLKESLITVIKQNPLTQPKVVTTVNDRVVEEITEIGGQGFGNNSIIQQNQGVFYSFITFGSIQAFGPNGTYTAFSFSNDNNEPFLPDGSVNGQPDFLQIKCSVSKVNWRIGDVLDLVGQQTGSQASVQIIGSDPGPGNTYNIFTVRLVNLAEGYDGTEPDETWNATLKNKKKVYEDDFVCFAYRYKYVDGEYSAISPYSDIAFVPGFYAFNPLKGFNDGMENKVQDIKVLDFIPPYIPDDVECVDLLFKNTNSTLVHAIETFKRGSSSWNTIGTPFSSYKGNVTISSEVFGKTLEESQSLRIFDNVPIKAKSQEITASRLLYGNYHENYNIEDESFRKITPSINSNVETLPIDFTQIFTATNEFSSSQGGEGTSVGEIMANSNIYPYDTFDVSGSGVVSIIAPEAADQFDDLSFAGANNTSADFPQGLQTSTLWGIPTFEENDPDNNFNNQIPVGQSAAVGAATDFSVQAKGPYFQAPTGGNYTFTASAKAAVILRPFNFVDNEGTISGLVNPGINCKGTKFGLFRVDENGIWEDWDNIHIGDNMDINHPSVFPDSLTPINMQLTQSAPIRDYEDHSFTITIYLNAGEKVAAGFCHNKAQLENYTGSLRLKECSFACTNAPDSTEALVTEQAKPSIKSIRTYEIGVVYTDAHGRESAVQLDKTSSLRVGKSFSDLVNRLSAQIHNKAPYWAEYYKFYVKEIASIYHNLVLYKAYPTGQTGEPGEVNFFNNVWLAFNSADRSKVKIGSYLIQKKQHGNSIAVHSEQAKYRVLDIVGNATVEVETDDEGNTTQQISIGTGTSSLDLDALGASFDDINGKFFVKIEAEEEFQLNINNDEEGISFITDDENTNNGAVFEVVDEQKVDLDLFYEVSQAYPINLLGEKASVLIKDKDTITLESGFSVAEINTFNNLPNLIKVENVSGASSLGPNQLQFHEEGCAIVYTNHNFGNLFGPNDLTNIPPKILRFTRPDGSYYTLRIIGLCSGNKLKIYPYTHKTSISNFSSKFLLRFVNCFTFGNGVESDRIRDDFNASTMYSYTSTGKQSGFKASLPDPDYQRDHKENDIIFSQIINEATGTNRANEFLMAENIIKRLNPEYGSIQKLFTRNTDLIAFCESKVLKILTQKDALFNADGNSQLLSTNKVLGQAIPYLGDYGISKNPESFASDEFRCYFTDVDRGAVCRLSRDGITAISDFGMKNFFYDNLKNAAVCIGDFDGRKDEYNLTIHTNNANISGQKNVYTVSYGEKVKGWTSFKSFIKEQGTTLNNRYYTFKDGEMWLHHYNQTHNNFYGTQFDSTIDVIFNNSPSVVKSFSTLNYEGTQSRVIANTQDEAFYNLTAKNGWYVESINTDLQEGVIDEFIDKENKWFNFIKGITTSHTNAADGTVTSNLDFSENTLQGIGQVSANATSDTVGFGEGFDVSVTLNTSSDQQFSSTGFSVNNISTLPSTGTFTIVPTQGYSIAASQFTVSNTLPSFISSITFADTGLGGTLTNTVTATITFTGSITEDLSHAVQVTASTFSTTVQVQGTITIVGAGIGQGETVSVSFGETESLGLLIPINSMLPNSVSYLYTAYTANNNGTNEPIFDITLNSGNFHFYDSNNLASLQIQPFNEADNYEIQQASATPIVGNTNVLTSQTYSIFYNTEEENVVIDDNNNITVFTNSIPVSCEFQSYPETDGVPVASFDDNNGISNISVPIFQNVPAIPSVQVADGGFVTGDGTTWLTPQTNGYIGTGGGGPQSVSLNNCSFSLSTNTGSARDLVLNLFSAVNNSSTPDDTLIISQSAVQTLDAKVQYALFPDNSNGLLNVYSDQFDHLDGTDSALTNSGPKINSNGYGDVISGAGDSLAAIKITAYADQGNFIDNNFTLSYESGGEGYIIDSSSDPISNGANLDSSSPGTGLSLVFVRFTENTTDQDRTIKVIVTHPLDNTLVDEVTITQKPAYNSSNNTLTFINNTGGQEGPPTPNTTPNFVDLNQFFNQTSPEQVVTIPSTSGEKFLYIKIPASDFNDIYNEFLLTSSIDPDNVSPLFPNLVFDGIFEPGSGGLIDEFGNFVPNVGLDANGNPQQSVGDIPYISYEGPELFEPITYGEGPGLAFYGAGLAMYKFKIIFTANDYVIPGNLLAETREFEIAGSHPYNTSGDADSIIKISQLAVDRCFFQAEGNVTIQEAGTDGLWTADLGIAANNATPQATIYKYQKFTAEGILAEAFIGAPDFTVENGTISSNGNTVTQQDYTARFSFNPPSYNGFWRVYVKAVHGNLNLNNTPSSQDPPEDSLTEDSKYIEIQGTDDNYFYFTNIINGNLTASELANQLANQYVNYTQNNQLVIGLSSSGALTRKYDLVYSGPTPTIDGASYYYNDDPGTVYDFTQNLTNVEGVASDTLQGFTNTGLIAANNVSWFNRIKLIEGNVGISNGVKTLEVRVNTSTASQVLDGSSNIRTWVLVVTMTNGFGLTKKLIFSSYTPEEVL